MRADEVIRDAPVPPKAHAKKDSVMTAMLLIPVLSPWPALPSLQVSYSYRFEERSVDKTLVYLSRFFLYSLF